MKMNWCRTIVTIEFISIIISYMIHNTYVYWKNIINKFMFIIPWNGTIYNTYTHIHYTKYNIFINNNNIQFYCDHVHWYGGMIIIFCVFYLLFKYILFITRCTYQNLILYLVRTWVELNGMYLCTNIGIKLFSKLFTNLM